MGNTLVFHFTVISDVLNVSEALTQVQVYPNPSTQEYVHLNLLDQEWKGSCESSITQLPWGKVVLEKEIKEVNAEIRLEGLEPGLYILKVHTPGGVLQKNLMKY